MMPYFPLINHYKHEVFALTTLLSLSPRICRWYMTRPHSCTNSSVKNLFSFRSPFFFPFETQLKFNEKKYLLCSLTLKANKSLQMQKFYRYYLHSVRNNLEMNKKFSSLTDILQIKSETSWTLLLLHADCKPSELGSGFETPPGRY